jgi:hypothetical protein
MRQCSWGLVIPAERKSFFFKIRPLVARILSFFWSVWVWSSIKKRSKQNTPDLYIMDESKFFYSMAPLGSCGHVQTRIDFSLKSKYNRAKVNV